MPKKFVKHPDLNSSFFFLGDEFHNAVAKDKDNVDLLIMIGSSLKVRPVALIPSSINTSVPQVCQFTMKNCKGYFIDLNFFSPDFN